VLKQVIFKVILVIIVQLKIIIVQKIKEKLSKLVAITSILKKQEIDKILSKELHQRKM